MSRQTERFCREIRRFNLTLRMIAQNARTRSVRSWTGWSIPRIQATASQYWHGRPRPHRPSGPSPSDLKRFWQSQRWQREAAALAGLYKLMGALPEDGTVLDERRVPDIERGELICLAYEIFRTFVPEPRITFEQALLLATALSSGKQIDLARCTECENLVLYERLASQRPCAHCSQELEAGRLQRRAS